MGEKREGLRYALIGSGCHEEAGGGLTRDKTPYGVG